MIDMSLTDLYARDKITASVEQAIAQKEDFSQIQPMYCERVCRLKCKNYKRVVLNHDPVDILIIQNHNAIRDKYRSAAEVEKTHRGIIQALAQKHFNGLTYRITNLLKCDVQPDDLTNKGKPPTQSTLQKCKPYLLEEIRRANPKVIISLQTESTSSIGLKLSNYTNRGEIHGNVILGLHPKQVLMIRQNASGGLWGTDFLDVIDRDFSKAGRVARGELVVPTLKEGLDRVRSQVFVCQNIEDVRRECEAIMALPANQIISFDTETTGLDPWAPDFKLLTAQFGYRKPEGWIQAVVVTLWHRENTMYNPDDAWQWVKDILESDLPKTGQNMKFDVLGTYVSTGVRIKNVVIDTMLAMHAINSGIQGCYGLKGAVVDFLPETGLSGYEDLLPGLTKSQKTPAVDGLEVITDE
jgi:hypothetical protein